MKFLTICSNCKIRSSSDERFCPQCGEEKNEDIRKRSLLNSIYSDISAKYDLSEDARVLLQLLLRIILLVCGLLFIPKFIQESELFLIALYIYAVFGIIKEIERRIVRLKGIYQFSRILLFAYIGAGLGNLVAHAGRTQKYFLCGFFNLSFLWDEISRGNILIIIGVISGILLFYSVILIAAQFKDSSGS